MDSSTVIPTAEDLFINYSINAEYDALSIETKEFIAETYRANTRLHVQAALEAAAENAEAKEEALDYGTGEIWVDKNSILNAYPLENIK